MLAAYPEGSRLVVTVNVTLWAATHLGYGVPLAPWLGRFIFQNLNTISNLNLKIIMMGYSHGPKPFKLNSTALMQTASPYYSSFEVF